jgi:hypothetical protein
VKYSFFGPKFLSASAQLPVFWHVLVVGGQVRSGYYAAAHVVFEAAGHCFRFLDLLAEDDARRSQHRLVLGQGLVVFLKDPKDFYVFLSLVVVAFLRVKDVLPFQSTHFAAVVLHCFFELHLTALDKLPFLEPLGVERAGPPGLLSYFCCNYFKL